MEITSTSIKEGQPIALAYANADAGGKNVSPQLSWTPGPEGTKSYAITIYDPEWTNDYQEDGYSGACPPPGPAHRYIHTVHAMPSEHLDIPDDAANVQVRFAIHTSELDSASITGTFQQS